MQKVRSHILLLTLLLGLGLYHGYNVYRGGMIRPWERVTTRNVETSLLGKRIVLTIPGIRSSVERVDSSSRLVSGIAFVLRYWCGEVVHFAIRGKGDRFENNVLRESVIAEYPSKKPVVTQLAAEMKRVLGKLDNAGVTTVVLPIPTKLSFYRDKFPRRLPPHSEWEAGQVMELPYEAEDPYEVYRAFVNTDPKHTIDLFQLFKQKLSEEPDQLVYVPWDYHWTSYGMNLTAAAVIEKLSTGAGKLGKLPTPEFVENHYPYFQDTLLYLAQLPRWFMMASPQFAWREPLFHLKGESSLNAKRVVVVGTSFVNRLRDTPYSFGSNLHSAVGGEIVYDAEDGSRVRHVQERLTKNHLVLKKGDILIWEFPFVDIFTPGPKLTPFKVEGLTEDDPLALR